MLENSDFSFYVKCMNDSAAHIEVVIDVAEPIELGDFVAAFTAIANQYQRYMRQAHPDLRDDATVFVNVDRRHKLVRRYHVSDAAEHDSQVLDDILDGDGSIIADLIPSAASLIGVMDQAVIVEQFIKLYGSRLGKYFRPGGRQEDASKAELKDFMGQVAAIARSKNGSGVIRAVVFEDRKREVRAAIEFNAGNAVQATKEIESHREELYQWP